MNTDTPGSTTFSDDTLRRIQSTVMFLFLGPLIFSGGTALIYLALDAVFPSAFANPYDALTLVVAAASVLSIIPCLLAGLLVNLVLSKTRRDRVGWPAMCGAAAFFVYGLLLLTLLDFKTIEPISVFLIGGTILTAIAAEIVCWLSRNWRRPLLRASRQKPITPP